MKDWPYILTSGKTPPEMLGDWLTEHGFTLPEMLEWFAGNMCAGARSSVCESCYANPAPEYARDVLAGFIEAGGYQHANHVAWLPALRRERADTVPVPLGKVWRVSFRPDGGPRGNDPIITVSLLRSDREAKIWIASAINGQIYNAILPGTVTGPVRLRVENLQRGTYFAYFNGVHVPVVVRAGAAGQLDMKRRILRRFSGPSGDGGVRIVQPRKAANVGIFVQDDLQEITPEQILPRESLRPAELYATSWRWRER